MSRLGGGIGTRGPGETKLEVDRQHIRRRISKLRRDIKGLAKSRGVKRARRERSGIAQVALAGYTNAGKSTLMNALTSLRIFSPFWFGTRRMLIFASAWYGMAVFTPGPV